MGDEGDLPADEDAGDSDDPDLVACPHCGGAGEWGTMAWWGNCAVCRGTGKVTANEAATFDRDEFFANDDGSGQTWNSVDHFAHDLRGGAASTDEFIIEDYEPRDEAGANTYWPGLPIAGVDLSGIDLEGSTFTDCDLVDVNFSGCTLTGSDLSRALLYGTDFRGAVLDLVRFDGCDLTYCAIENARSLIGVDLGVTSGLTPERLARCLRLGAVTSDEAREWIGDREMVQEWMRQRIASMPIGPVEDLDGVYDFTDDRP